MFFYLARTFGTFFKKYTLVCAINSKGIVGFELYENGGINSIKKIGHYKCKTG